MLDINKELKYFDEKIKELDNIKKDEIEIPTYIEELANDLSGGWWNYRIIEKEAEYRNIEGEIEKELYYEIHEVYYKADGSIWSWTERPVSIYFENVYDLKNTIKTIKKASKMTILKLIKDNDDEEHLENTNKYIKEVK